MLKQGCQIMGLCLAAWIPAAFGTGQPVSFNAPQAFPAGRYPVTSVTADFNGDGKLDLATAGGGCESISISLGNGDGTFQHKVTYTLEAVTGFGNSEFTTSCLAIGDF